MILMFDSLLGCVTVKSRVWTHLYELINMCNLCQMYPPSEAMIVGTSLTEMKSEILSIIPSKAHPKLRMSAGNNSPE